MIRLAPLLVLLVICCFSPGFLVVRRLRWSPLEKLCGAIGLSLILIYLASAALYWLNLPGPWSFWAVSLVCLAAGVVARRDAVRLAKSAEPRRAIAGFACLLIWTLALLAMIRNYSGGGWACDWQEHFQRTLFFLHHMPATMPVVSGGEIPSRPPMMNLLASFFLAQTADRFELFQATFTFLNLLLWFPCYLISAAFQRRGRRRIVLLAALFALNPMVMENATYAWTKQLAAFYVVLSLWFYLAGWRKNDRVRMAAAFAALAAGMLVHYSTGPYLVFVALHYVLFLFWRRRQKWRELATAVAGGGLLLASWFAWSIAVYGWRVTFLSNTTVTSSEKYEGSNLKKAAANFFDTLAPFPLRTDAPLELLDQPSRAGWLRDSAFLIYQTNAIFAMGAVGGPLVLYLLWKAMRQRRRESVFWLMLIPFCLVAGVAVQGERECFGVAHVTLQTLMALGLTFLSASFFHLRRLAAMLLIAGCVTDFALGVFLQAQVENAENSAENQVFSMELTGTGMQPLSYQLAPGAWPNWMGKHMLAASSRSIEESVQNGLITANQAQMRRSFYEQWDRDHFGGWYGRHNGEMVFLGDQADRWSIEEVNPATAMVATMFLAWIAGLLREADAAGFTRRRGARISGLRGRQA
ncbi:MAG TPA: hypothetical protein VE959_28030 [Bryobacteraceae bacterium]|nr:hypothetical protein [Bryobacteraceae bacterium]